KKQEDLKRAKAVKERKSVNKEISDSSGNWITIEASYYTAKCKGCSGFTKTEIDVRNTVTYQGMRIIATDPNVIPLWSIVEIKTKNGSYKAIALDTGGAIRHHKIDVLVSSTKEAINLGRHNV